MLLGRAGVGTGWCCCTVAMIPLRSGKPRAVQSDVVQLRSLSLRDCLLPSTNLSRALISPDTPDPIM